MAYLATIRDRRPERRNFINQNNHTMTNHQNENDVMTEFRSAYAYAIRHRRPSNKRELFYAYWRHNYPMIHDMIPSDEIIDAATESHQTISDAVVSIADDIMIEKYESGDHNGRR